MSRTTDQDAADAAAAISDDTGTRQVDPEQVAAALAAGADLEVKEGTALQRYDSGRVGDMGLATYIQAQQPVEGRTREEVAYLAIIQQILDAETPEDVLTPIEAVNARDVLDRPLVVKRWEAVESDYEQGSPFYAAIQVTHMDTGEQGVVTTGNQALLAQLISLGLRAAFPVEAKFVEVGEPNKYGTIPLRMAKPNWESRKHKKAAG